MNHATFAIAYDGPALETHEMDVKQLAPALHSLGTLFEAANRVLNGTETAVQVRVKGSFKSGSFGIDLHVSQKLLQSCISFLTGKELDAAIKLVTVIGFGYAGGKSLLSLLAWLRGRTISSVTVGTEDVTIKTADNDSCTTSMDVINLLRDLETRKAVDAVINQPLQMEGITSFHAKSGDADLFSVTREEASYYLAPDVTPELLQESTRTVVLQLVSVSFQDDNKWRFSDGSLSFYAVVADNQFMERINNHEISFTKGDTLRVELRCVQYRTDKGIKSEYSVEKVIEHISQAVQINLPFS